MQIGGYFFIIQKNTSLIKALKYRRILNIFFIANPLGRVLGK